MKEKFSDYFAGIVTHDISKDEQYAYNKLVKMIKDRTRAMIKYEAQKIQKKLKIAN